MAEKKVLTADKAKNEALATALSQIEKKYGKVQKLTLEDVFGY